MPLLEFVVPGPPVSHQTSDKTNLKAWQATIKAEAAKFWTNPPLKGKLKFLLINFHEGDKPPLDDDNMVKPVRDALNKLVYDDDRQIRDALNKLVYDDDRQIRYSETLQVSIDDPVRIRKASRILLDAFCKGDEFLYVRIEDAPKSSNCRSNAMDYDEELERIVKQYQDEGYLVITHPDRDHLPGFAADFGVDIMAARGNERVLVQVKHDRADLEADPSVPSRAEITNAQPGWQYDLVLLNPDNPVRRTIRDAAEPSTEQIEQMLHEAEMVLRANALRAAFVLAWSGLEASMRRLAQRAGLNGKVGTQPLLLGRELYSSGYISQEDFHRLEQTRRLRTEIVHGLVPAVIDEGAVQYVIGFARQLLAQSANVRDVAS